MIELRDHVLALGELLGDLRVVVLRLMLWLVRLVLLPHVFHLVYVLLHFPFRFLALLLSNLNYEICWWEF